ncbi:MAG TPA: helix-turn-helix domain-containing protein [Microbacteriaceae bacterium]|nr:helix-turn-helix domain-containing protein [Rhodoglobus sp.]HQC92528.1 helix-turn-helix domain-containing protein [Microbacteriaceae bacterium]
MTNKTSTPTRKTGTSDELLRAYTIPDAAERLSMDERTFRRMVERGEVEVFYPRGKKGRNSPVRISEQALRDVFARTAV